MYIYRYIDICVYTHTYVYVCNLIYEPTVGLPRLHIP